jgi:hypothetical protein
LLLKIGLTCDLFLADVVNAGFAEAKTERTLAAGRAVEVSRVRITDAGEGMVIGDEPDNTR